MIDSASIGVKECPDQVHDKMKNTESKLKYLLSCPQSGVFLSHDMGSPDTSICKLVIDGGDRVFIEIFRVPFKLSKVNIIVNHDISLHRCFFNGGSTEWIELGFVTCQKWMSWLILELGIILKVRKASNMFRQDLDDIYCKLLLIHMKRVIPWP